MPHVQSWLWLGLAYQTGIQEPESAHQWRIRCESLCREAARSLPHALTHMQASMSTLRHAWHTCHLYSCWLNDRLVLCSVQEVMKRFKLREQAGADPQTYALGLKEVWEVSTPP